MGFPMNKEMYQLVISILQVLLSTRIWKTFLEKIPIGILSFYTAIGTVKLMI